MTMPISLEPESPAQEPGRESFGQKVQEKLAESRYFFLSLLVHVCIVIAVGTIVIYKAIEAPDFVAGGGDALIVPVDDWTPPAADPAESRPPDQIAQPEQPSINSPSVDVVTTTAQTNSFRMAPTAIRVNVAIKASDIMAVPRNLSKGVGGGLGRLPGTMAGRTGTGRRFLMVQNNMKDWSELAVLRALEWLRTHQNADGSWGDKNMGGMTGLALLCFLGHGETPESAQYGVTVNTAVQWLIDNGTANQGRLNMAGGFSQPGVYEHGIATYALGEYFTMTRDERVLEVYKQAVAHIVQGQGPGGGWMYAFDKTANDLSVSGWQIQALKAAYLTQLNLPGVKEALDKAMVYIGSVRGPHGGYGYRAAEDRYSLTGVGMLSSLFWKGNRGELQQGIQWMLGETERKFPVKYHSGHADLYAWYYHSQACLMFGGSVWTKWNHWFQDEIVGAQSADGSWPKPGGSAPGPQAEDSQTGQVYRTTLCVLMLEVFYRYMPTHRG